MKNELRSKIIYLFFGCAVVFLSSAWKNVGMTVMCTRCDVMNIMWCKNKMEQKSTEKGEEMGREGVGEGERERACWALEYGFIGEKKNGGGGGGGGGGWSYLGKGQLPVPNSPGDEWKNQSTQRRKNISWMQWKPYDINLDECFTVMKAQENQQKQTKKERESASHAHIHSHSHTRAYMQNCSSMVGYSEGIGGSRRG